MSNRSSLNLDKFERDIKLYLCALHENIYDRIIQRMNDFAVRGEGPAKHSETDPPYCANPGCEKICLASDGTTPGYPDGTFFLYCPDCSESINNYRNRVDPVE